jgi:hypothetical protein
MQDIVDAATAILAGWKLLAFALTRIYWKNISMRDVKICYRSSQQPIKNPGTKKIKSLI